MQRDTERNRQLNQCIMIPYQERESDSTKELFKLHQSPADHLQDGGNDPPTWFSIGGRQVSGSV
jgi:hypothetical protein